MPVPYCMNMCMNKKTEVVQFMHLKHFQDFPHKAKSLQDYKRMVMLK